ncbi:glycosyltransferase, partial [Balneolaceae bacterium ANBcel3]|nr:glycosyltransferase [Balneolaceae bacterium ANBcel3]
MEPEINSDYPFDVSVVVVNYNVKEFVANLLGSVQKASEKLKVEVIVVDNASSDGSVNYLKKRFPDLQLIANKDNAGFGKANNQAIHKANGKYILLINPDTLVRKDTLQTMFNHMEKHPESAAAGCKILNPDGTFAPESRRSVPTPMSALWKILGMNRLFPKSKRFSAYYMGGLDEDKEGMVPVLSGAFMFCRADVLKKIKGFDERFFMYGEDIDLCYRITKEGWNIDYVPSTSIIHYKGESTKKENLDYVLTFNKAMYQFFTKHYSFGYTLLFRLFVLSGIILKGFISYLNTLIKKLSQPVFEISLLNIFVIIFFMWRFDISFFDMPGRYNISFFAINVILSGFFLASALYYDLYGKNRLSVPAIVKSTGIAFAGVVLVTFFLRELAFSRLVLLLSAISSTLILVLVRLFMINRSGRIPNVPGSFVERRLLLVGINEKTPELIRKLRSKANWKYSIVGIVSQNESEEVDE